MNAPLPQLRGLVLAGGHSRRMGRDKAALEHQGRTQLERAMELLRPLCISVHVSVRADQRQDPLRARFPQVVDRGFEGPAAGIHSAQQQDPDCAWLVVACDLPLLDAGTLRHLVSRRDPARMATAYRSSHDGLPEPLCAIWEPASGAALESHLTRGKHCPRKFLINADVLLLDQPRPEALDNMNTPEDLAAAQARHAASGGRPIHVQYFALLREQAGRREETVESTARTPAELFRELTARHRFTLPADMLKVAINSEFRDWSHPLKEGDAVVFIPPVAGG